MPALDESEVIIVCEKCLSDSVRGVQLEVLRPEGFDAFQCECIDCGHKWIHEEERDDAERSDCVFGVQG